MITIYKQLLAQIKYLEEVAESQELDANMIHSLSFLEKSIPANEIASKVYYLFKKSLKPPKNQEQYDWIYNEVYRHWRTIYQQINDKLQNLKEHELPVKQEHLSAAQMIHAYYTNPESYLDFRGMANAIDLSQSWHILAQYDKALRECRAYIQEINLPYIAYRHLHTGKALNELLHYTAAINDNLNGKIIALKRMEKLCLNAYKDSILKNFLEYFCSTISNEIVFYINTKMIRPWNQYFERETKIPYFSERKKLMAYLKIDMELKLEKFSMETIAGCKEDWGKYRNCYQERAEQRIREILYTEIKNHIIDYISNLLQELAKKNSENIPGLQRNYEETVKQVQKTEMIYSNLKEMSYVWQYN